MCIRDSLRDDQIAEILADDIVPGIAENSFGSRVPLDEPALEVVFHRAERRLLEVDVELLLGVQQRVHGLRLAPQAFICLSEGYGADFRNREQPGDKRKYQQQRRAVALSLIHI